MKKIIPLLLCGIILLSGCQSGATEPLPTEDDQGITLITPDLEIPDETLPPETLPTSPTEPPVTDEAPGEYVYSVSQYDYSAPEDGWNGALFEIESGMLGADGAIGDAREGYSGSGYVTANGRNAAVTVLIDIPAPNHYNITIRSAADNPAAGKFWCDGVFSDKEISVSGTGEYETVLYSNIYFPAGASSLTFGGFSGAVDLDCVFIELSDDVSSLGYNVAGELSNLNASDSAKALYKYITDNYGKAVLSGQQCSQGSNAEIEAIANAVGRYPAIRFGELSGYSSGVDTGDIELAIEWAHSGGIVGYSWYFALNGSLEQFDLSKAVTDLDIASMDGGALTQRFSDGDITAETLLMIDGIDLVAAQLKRLQDEDIPVLLRPLPEAGNGVFWWGKDPASYLWLYKLLYERLDFFHGLDNIIWVWNGQNLSFYVGDDMCDIVSLDLYYPEGQEPTQSGINFMLAAREFTSSKPIALSECGALPSPDAISMDRCYWSYASVWSGDYAVTDGGLSEKYLAKGAWNNFYSSDIVITRDEIEYDR